MIAFATMTALMTLGSSPAANSASPPAATPISLDEALRLGELHIPLVRRARAKTHLVAARDVGASLILPSNPVVAALVGPRRENRAAGNEQGLCCGPC